MKHKIKIFAFEDDRADKELIVGLLGEEDFAFCWASEDALKGIENNDCGVALAEIEEIKPDCLIVDLALTPRQREIIEELKGKPDQIAERTPEDLGGGFLLVRQTLENDILSRESICIFTEHDKGSGLILVNISKTFFDYEIPVYQKKDEHSHFKLRRFAYESRGIRIKYVYTLIDQADDKVRESIIGGLDNISEALKIKWFPATRTSLKNAEEWWSQDKNVPFGLAFFDLSLTPSDDETFERIKDELDPELSLDSFSPLRFAKEFKEKRKSCPLIFLTNIEKRSLVIYLLSGEVNGDWVMHKDTLTLSLVSLLIKLFVKE